MSGDEALYRGRLPLDLLPNGDYSGLNLSDRHLLQGNLDRHFFNGADLNNCAFSDLSIQNTEFTEATATHSVFVRCKLTGSDFINTVFDRVLFVECDFSRGELREAVFKGCSFESCTFDHTTVTLCEFSTCAFDALSLKKLEHRAVYFNVFTRCHFPELELNHSFGSRNFGIPLTPTTTDLVRFGDAVTLEQVCLLNNMGGLKAIAVADAADGLHADLIAHGRRRVSALSFYGRIIRVLTAERRISATSLTYIEDSVTRLAASVNEQDVFIAAMSAVIEIRSALFAIVSEVGEQPRDDSGLQQMTIYFTDSYSRHQAEVLREALGGEKPHSFDITEFRNGSTWIEMVSVTAVTVSTALGSLNLVLRQAKVTIERVDQLRRAAAKLSNPARRTAPRKVLAPRAPEVQSLMRTGAVSSELAPVRAAVRRHGRILIELDDRAEVALNAQDANLGRKKIDPPIAR